MRVAGIHVDGRRIRIIEVDLGAKKMSLLKLYEMDRGSSESLSEILKNYFASNTKPDRVVASIGNVPLVTKSFAFPFRDRSKVQMAIQSEFEDSLPVEIDKYVIEFQAMGKKDGLYDFMGALVSREPLEDMNHVFENADVLPSDFLIPAEAIGRMGLSLLADDFNPGSVVCFCDIGFDVSQVAIVRYPLLPSKKAKASDYNESMLESRHITRGSKDIYDREASKLAITVREFEEWLTQKVSFVEGAAQLDEMKNSIRPFLVELYQVTQAAFSKSGQKVDHYVLTGPLSRTPGFREFFEHELRTPTLVWDPFQSIDSSKTQLTPNALSKFIIPLALSLRYGVLRSLPWLNFKRSSQRKKVISAALDKFSEPELKAKLIPIILTTIATFVIAVGASFLMDARIEKQATRTKSALAKTKAPMGTNVERLIDDPSEVVELFAEYKAKKMKAIPGATKKAPFIKEWLELSQSLPLNVKVEELKLTSTSKGPADITALLNIEKTPTVKKEDLKKDLEAKGFSQATLQDQGSTKLSLKAKGH